MLPITQLLLTNRRTRPALRDKKWYSIRELKGIVMHWTANESAGAHARANRNYFNTVNNVWASAHYIVDDHEIIQCLPDDEVGYHVGGRYYRPIGQSIKEGKLSPNYFLIGIEMCVNRDGDWESTYQKSVALARHLLDKHGLTVNELYRHYDITGKDCPKMMLTDEAWQEFKDFVNGGVKEEQTIERPLKQGVISSVRLNVRKGNATSYPIVEVLHSGDVVDIYQEFGEWYRIGTQRWVYKWYVDTKNTKNKDKIGSVETARLNVRIGPDQFFAIADVLNFGEVVHILEEDGGWYRIGKNRWVMQEYIQVSDIKSGRIVAPSLNVRKGPDSSYRVVKFIPRNTIVKIFDTNGNWLKIGHEQWVYGTYVEVN